MDGGEAQGVSLHLMHLFGNLGHVVILGPLSLATLFYLLAVGARRDAAAFALALLACLAATLGAKLFFSACGAEAPHARMESPSGHESFSAAAYGCIALIVATGRPKLQQALIGGAAALLIVLIGIGRVAQHAHSPQEVAFGLSIGIAATALFHLLRGAAAKPIPLPWRAMALLSPAALVLAFAALVFLRHWTPEYFIEGVGRRLGAHFGLCL